LIHCWPFDVDCCFEIVGNAVNDGDTRVITEALRQTIYVLCCASFLHRVKFGITEFFPHDNDGKCEQDGIEHAYGSEFESRNIGIDRPFGAGVAA
jgi:hypothetical protein